MIGRLSTLKEGAFISYLKEIYHMRNAFSLIREFLYAEEFRFNSIFNIFDGKVYFTPRQKLKEKEFEEDTKFGVKVFLELNKWSDNQY